jgi:hypothetical protein
MSDRLERLRNEIAAEKAAVLNELGLSFSGPLLVPGDVDPTTAIETRLARVPAQLRDEARVRMRRAILVMPWLRGRRVGVQA